jgi:hypothetical protein
MMGGGIPAIHGLVCMYLLNTVRPFGGWKFVGYMAIFTLVYLSIRNEYVA